MKAKTKRPDPVFVARDPAELAQDVADHLDALTALCAQYDQGRTHFASEIATNLRTLFYDKFNLQKPHTSSRSLLFQLGRLDAKLIDSGYSLTNGNEFQSIQPGGGLTFSIGVVQQGMHVQGWMPTYDSFINRGPFYLDLDTWMNRTLMCADEEKYSRIKLIIDMSNQDRGAHRGVVLSERYNSLSRKNSQIIYSGRVPGDAIANPELFSDDKIRIDYSQKGSPLRFVRATMRQIGHETLLSLLPDDQIAMYQSSIPPFKENIEVLTHFIVHHTNEYK